VARVWQDTAADLTRRSKTWRSVLEGAGVTTSDRVLVRLPAHSAVAYDAYAALLEIGSLTFFSRKANFAEIMEFAPTVLIGTLTDTLALAHTAALQLIDLMEGPLQLAVITGEPGASLEVTRRSIEDRWGASCLDVYTLTELGVIGWSCNQRRDGMHLDDRQLALEVLQPDTDEPVPDGELGELVLTTPDDWGTPLRRFRTSDLVRLRPGVCRCGTGAAWIEGGVLGRVEEQLPMRGTVILPSTIEQVVRRHPAVIEFALRGYGDGHASVYLETTPAISTEGDQSRVAAEVAEDIRRTLGLRLLCEVVAPGVLSSTRRPGERTRRLTRP
jgi:phenylacetate-CoA ligase